MESSKTILARIFAEYYLGAAQAKKEGRPVAHVTAFTPVEILRAMGITCVYPESYAVVCSASGKATEMIEASEMTSYAQDLCSYSLISFGTDGCKRLPYGGLPKPDFLVAANNQCGTTLLWFRLLAQKKNIPLFVMDYPTVVEDSGTADYILRQYESLIAFVTKVTGQKLDFEKLGHFISNAREATRLWSELNGLNKLRQAKVDAAKLVNALFAIVAAKGSDSVCRYYEALIREHTQEANDNVQADNVRLLWHGYPLWFLPGRFPPLFDKQFQIVMTDYVLWWDLEYGSQDTLEALITPYANTYLNWPLERRIAWMDNLISDYRVDGVVLHANRSCRRALAHLPALRAYLDGRNIPWVMLESDMANPDFYSQERMKIQLESFRERLKSA